MKIINYVLGFLWPSRDTASIIKPLEKIRGRLELRQARLSASLEAMAKKIAANEAERKAAAGIRRKLDALLDAVDD